MSGHGLLYLLNELRKKYIIRGQLLWNKFSLHIQNCILIIIFSMKFSQCTMSSGPKFHKHVASGNLMNVGSTGVGRPL